MEFRVLEYFLAVTREQSILGAAESLHLTQPTLSRQLTALEQELGKQLFIRGNRKITLTEEGMLLRKRAEEILELVRKTEDEISLTSERIAGDIHIGAGESDGLRTLIKAAREIREAYPEVHFHIVSGDKVTVLEALDRGLLDFGMVFGSVDASRYAFLKIPYSERYGVLMPREDPLSEKAQINAEDLFGKPLIIPRQLCADGELHEVLRCDPDKLDIVASYNLLFNGSLMVEEGMGYAIGLDKIIHTTGDSRLCFRPLSVPFSVEMCVVWKKYQILSRAAELFLRRLREAQSAANERS
ncbi:MAG: LysR family transcriptional regulator [Firmicutes bacterium]|nr:LysR family transcriptional regulator [Bacillota bacterium]